MINRIKTSNFQQMALAADAPKLSGLRSQSNCFGGVGWRRREAEGLFMEQGFQYELVGAEPAVARKDCLSNSN